MKYPKDFYRLVVDAIGDQVTRVEHHQLAGAGNSAGASKTRLQLKQGDGGKDS
ncbi:hypothetical protein FBY03_12224 [Pseudomonas sp. SJZ079]|nr:hypothetical protein FBY03_12224 [Pseudomonas sp. SJZ079]